MSGWTVREITALWEEYEASAALKDLTVQVSIIFLLSLLLLIIKPMASPLWGTSDMEHTSILIEHTNRVAMVSLCSI